MVRILLIVIYALASATIGSLAGMMQSLPIGIASGFIAFLLLCQIDGAVLRRRFARQQKKEIAELESQCAANIANREILLKGEIVKAIDKGDAEAVAQLEKQLLSDRKTLRAECEEKKEKVRSSTKRDLN